MLNIDFDALNPLEQQIHTTLKEASRTTETIRITDAAQMCSCSISKISKFVQKLGFANYKKYLDYLYGRAQLEANQPSELERIGRFLEAFDQNKVKELASLIHENNKLVLLGYGPSYLCAQYFEYKFKTCTNKICIAVPDDLTASSIIDANTLLLVFTVTGAFKSFEEIHRETKMKGADVAIIMEEYNPSTLKLYDRIFCLTDRCQPSTLKPFQKTRTVFFIFMEEVIRELSRLQ
ncbi:transcriptional regulator, RpiR family [Cohaesibacter sp. ES.047]|uniref:MurR/RpiR family transcriptional regulator n=1 Tax=Cohaesibacter sp. ES.047 TaxID=1798205 RepID=UPI000BB96560|nr:SIS domain-containing protein [Cohaesibacter sp. ES.047]SNY92381.1 transcriptional regulator, RpiR family [Cohaesibacter sp. ES.047]